MGRAAERGLHERVAFIGGGKLEFRLTNHGARRPGLPVGGAPLRCRDLGKWIVSEVAEVA
jgi:hypothetical protein